MTTRLRFGLLLLALCAFAPLAKAIPVSQKEFDLVLKRSPDATRGATLYETCAACHGERGGGLDDGSVPAIAGQPFAVLAKQLVDFRHGVRSDPHMQHFSDTRHLAYSQDVADVALYVSRLPPRVSGDDISAEIKSQGAKLYTRACKRCHGATAEGNGDELAPRLAGQHADYIVRQLHDAVDGKRPAMTRTHAALLSGVPREQVAALATFLSSTGSGTTRD